MMAITTSNSISVKPETVDQARRMESAFFLQNEGSSRACAYDGHSMPARGCSTSDEFPRIATFGNIVAPAPTRMGCLIHLFIFIKPGTCLVEGRAYSKPTAQRSAW